MTKDRLEEMQKLMRFYANGNTVENGEKEKSITLIKFCEQVRDIKQELTELKTKVNDLKLLINDNSKWITDASRKESEQKIEKEKLVIGTAAKAIRNNLRSMKSSSNEDKQKSVIIRIKEVQINSVLNELNEILKDYLNCLVIQRERSVKVFRDMMKVKGDEEEDIETLLEEGKISIFTNNLLINDLEERFKLREAEERRDNILKIESTILEVRNLFNELSLIVDLQQDKIEEVEKLVESNLDRVERGKRKIVSASKNKSKNRYRKIIIALICGSFILIILILLTIV